MLACAVIVATIALVSTLPVLPSSMSLLYALAVHGAMGILGRYFPLPGIGRRVWGLALLALLAALWSTHWGHQRLDNRLAPALEGDTLQVVGTVDSLPIRTERGVRFVLKLESMGKVAAEVGGPTIPLEVFPEYIRLNWYSDTHLPAGSRVALRVKLKRPHGYVNLGGFDYERWLLSRGIGATGYVRKWSGNKVLQDDYLSFSSIHRLRQDYKTKVLEGGGSRAASAIAVALMTGDKSAINPSDRTRLQYLGLAHLLAISGLHIGLAAGVGLFLGQGVGRCFNALFPAYCYTPVVALGCAWFAAASYGLLAGLSLPTQRALLMLTVWVLVSLGGYRFSPWFSWWFALAAVFCCFPLSLYDLGVWLSFGAVAILIATFQGRWVVRTSRWRDLLLAQAVLFVALGLLQWFAGLPVSLVSPVVNFLVIPYVGVLVVPPLLFMAVIGLVDAVLFGWLLGYALLPLEFLVWALDQFESGLLMFGDWESWLWQRSGVAPIEVRVLMFLVVLLLFGPLPRLLKALALLGSASVIFPQQQPSIGLEVAVLDVGQGLAVAVHEGGRHHLVDVGRDFHVAGVLLPYFRFRGVSQLNTVVVSHGDADHAGGLPSLVSHMPIEELWIRTEDARRWLPEKVRDLAPLVHCRDKGASYWGEVRVTRFGVADADFNNANDRSCVLLLEYAGVRILLPGDIERNREQPLLSDVQLSGAVDILLAPHHGSRTSSGSLWVQQLRPRWAVFSAGYRNGYGHPAREVVDRYRLVGSKLLNTAEIGAIHFTVSPQGRVDWSGARNLRKRYWM